MTAAGPRSRLRLTATRLTSMVIGMVSGVAMSALTVAADESLDAQPFMACAAHFTSLAYMLESQGHDAMDQAAQARESVGLYLSTAELITGSPSKELFVQLSQQEFDASGKAWDKGGKDGFLAYTARRQGECQSLVQQHQAALQKLAQALPDT